MTVVKEKFDAFNRRVQEESEFRARMP